MPPKRGCWCTWTRERVLCCLHQCPSYKNYKQSLCHDADVGASFYLSHALACPEPCILKRSQRNDPYEAPGQVLPWALWDGAPLDAAIIAFQSGRHVQLGSL